MGNVLFTRRKRIALLCLGAAGIVGLCFFFCREPATGVAASTERTSEFFEAGGGEVPLLAVTFGDMHQPPETLNTRAKRLLPEFVREFLPSMSYSPPMPIEDGRPGLGVWVPNSAARGTGCFIFTGEDGTEVLSYSSMSGSVPEGSFSFYRVYPRRLRVFQARAAEIENGGWVFRKPFQIVNPDYGSVLPKWPVPAMPATSHDRGTEFEVVEVGAVPISLAQPGATESWVEFRVKRPGYPEAEWAVEGMAMSDSSGNYADRFNYQKGNKILFELGLWASEPWKVNVTYYQTTNFDSNETARISVDLPPAGQESPITKTVINGVECELQVGDPMFSRSPDAIEKGCYLTVPEFAGGVFVKVTDDQGREVKVSRVLKSYLSPPIEATLTCEKGATRLDFEIAAPTRYYADVIVQPTKHAAPAKP